MAQHKATLRKTVRSAMTHKEAADQILEALNGIQKTMNDLLAKLDSDTGVTDTDFAALLGVSELDLD